jgi:hypothetical protein
MSAKIVPMVVGSMALALATISLLNQVFRPMEREVNLGMSGEAKAEVEQKIHMDLGSDTAHLSTGVIVRRAAMFFGWLIAFMGSMATIGLVPTVPLFVVAYMRLEGGERWSLVFPQAVLLTVFIFVVFDYLLTIPWPPTLLGGWIPALKFIPSV